MRGRYHYAHCSCNDAAKPYDSWLAIGQFTRTNDGKLAVEHFVRDNMRRIKAGEFTGLVKTRLQPKASAQPAAGNPASGEVPVNLVLALMSALRANRRAQKPPSGPKGRLTT